MSEDDRYSRQSLIPGWDQSTLEQSTAIIVGVGATGSYVSTILASSGVANLVIIDFDTIELSNLNRQLLFRNEDVGKSKSEVAATRLRELNPNINISFYHKKMENVPKSVYEKADVIVGCLDTFIGRRWINSMAVKLNKPLVLGGMFAFLGDIQVIIPKKSPCFECQPLVGEEELAQACTPFGEERKKERGAEQEAKEKLPAVASMSSIIGGLMAQAALKIILRLGVPIENYLFYDGLNNAFTVLPLARREKDCPACGELYELEKVNFVINESITVKEALIQIGFSYGLESPSIMIKGQILQQEKIIRDYNIADNSVAFIMDANLAHPLKLVLKIEK